MRTLATSSLFLLATSAAVGQTREDAGRLLTRGDTAGAIAAYEALIGRNERDAEAHYQVAQLYLARVDPDAAVSEDRRQAEAHLRYAARFAPDSARYWLALADYFRSQNLITLLVQTPSAVGRARDAADRSGNPVEIAGAAYRTAQLSLDRWQQYGRRYTAVESDAVIPSGIVPTVETEWKYWDDYVTRGLRPAAPGMGLQHLAAAEQALEHGLAAESADCALLGLLVVVLGETDRWPEAAARMRRVTEVAPDSGRAWALYGLALTRIHRWHDAQQAFHTALERMTPEQRAPYLNIGRIMLKADSIRWQQMPTTARGPYDSVYWRAAQPLLLTETNELKVEYYARLTYVDHRWTDLPRRYRGYDTDMGAVYVHYGPPDVWVVQTPVARAGLPNVSSSANPGDSLALERTLDASQTVIWLYRPPQFRFVFEQTSGFAHTYFVSNSREAFRVDQTLAPARFDNVPIYRAMDTIAVQAAQFRGPEDSTAIAVFGALPLRRMTDSLSMDSVSLVSGAFLQSRRGTELLRDRRSETLRLDAETPALQHRSWRLTMGPGEYTLRVEALIPAHDRAARGVAPFAVRSYWGSWLMLSDLLVAGRVAPRDSLASRWSDYLIEPNGGWFTPGEQVGLLWEIYNLTPDEAGQVAYAVDLRFTVDALTRRSTFAQVVGGIADAVGLTAKGDDRIALHYTHTTDATPNYVNVEYLMVDLKDSPEGTYTIEVEVRDLRTGGTAVQRRVIHVDRSPPTKCDPCPTQWP
jgi:GWxTD domain-containing protein